MKKSTISLTHVLKCVILILVLAACSNSKTSVPKAFENIDLPQIIKKGKLTVLAENSSSSYFIYRGKKMGFEYEILREFAQEIGVELEVKIIDNLDEVSTLLNEKEGDIVACNYVITNKRQKSVDFSVPFLRSSQVLIQQKPDGWEGMTEVELRKKLLIDPIQLVNKKIYVWKNSSYYERLKHLEEEMGDPINIQVENGEVSSEDLIEEVAEGVIDYTVVEKNVAQINQRFFENIDISLELSVRQKIAFALRKTSPLLKAKLNQWLTKYMQGASFKYMKVKYFELATMNNQFQDEYSSLKGGKLSRFDHIFKREASKYNWDWQLLAAVAYQESKFNPTINGFGGAFGLMQFMPEIGPRYGVYPNSSPEIQIAGGMRKLIDDYNCWPEIPNKIQRQKFALASYNAGLGHVKDAQRIAEKNGFNPKIWDRNVEIMLNKLSHKTYYRSTGVENGAIRGSRTQRYVNSVFSKYLSFKSMYR